MFGRNGTVLRFGLLAINSIIITGDSMKHYTDIEMFKTKTTLIEKTVLSVCLIIGVVLLTLFTPFAWLAGKLIK